VRKSIVNTKISILTYFRDSLTTIHQLQKNYIYDF
jgi:hypothetical protein